MDCKEEFRRKIKMFEELEAYLEQLVTADQFSGTVLVAKEEVTLFQKAYGMAEKNFNVPAQIETKFNLGSMNKMFTGVAIAQLAEQGKVSFHDPSVPICQTIQAREPSVSHSITS
jgi:CubicO group peptidase (beta-lactamase class C family)